MMTLPNRLVLVNTVAGHGQGARVWPRVAAYLSGQGLAAELVEARSTEEFEGCAAGALMHSSVRAMEGPRAAPGC